MARKKRMPVPGTVEELKENMGKLGRPSLDTGVYWWIWALEQGKRMVLGPFLTEGEAWRYGYSKLASNFEVKDLHTRDEAKASRYFRAQLLDETNDISTTFKRFRHEVNGNHK